MSQTVTSAASVSPVLASPAVRRGSTPSKVVHHPLLLSRVQPLKLPALLRPLVRRGARLSPGAWILGAAQQLAGRVSASVPELWLDKLASAFELPRSAAAPAEFFGELIKPAWNEATLLGELLLLAREQAAGPARAGRAGRVSIGSVYTPAAVARAIVAEVHVGARRVLDPACGSGAFLLSAFQRAYHRRCENGEAPLQAAQTALQHELIGIDIDGQALAVAEFSLRLLALRLSGLSSDVPLDLRLADALRPLPELESNCDCIVGNPPFVEGRGLSDEQLSQLRQRFRCAESGKVNLFAVFVERSLQLLKEGGVLALVLPATFLRNARYQSLRQILLEHTLESIKPLDAGCFDQRVIETVVLRARKRPPARNSRVELAQGATLQCHLPLGPALRFCDNMPQSLRRQVETLQRHGVPLSEHFEVRDGISTGFQPFPQRLLGLRASECFVALQGTRVPFDPAVHKKVIDGGEFSAFTPITWAGRYIEHDKRHEHTPPHPGRSFNCQLRLASIYDRPEKILTRQTARGLIATVDRQRYFVRNSVHVTYAKGDLSLDALCACLNSKLYCDYYLAISGEDSEVFPQVHIADLRALPVLPGLLKPDGQLAQLGAALLACHAGQSRSEEDIRQYSAAVAQLLRDAFGLEGCE